MSLNWQWNDKMGEVIFTDDCYTPGHPYVTNIYQGNALMIWCNEWATNPACPLTPDNTSYSLHSFCANLDHLRNMLGLNAKKGYGTENYFNGYNIKLLRLNTKYKSVPKIVAEFAKAHTNITIELYYEE
jgi:hypothetical protein